MVDQLGSHWAVEGRQHVPREGPCIVVANHLQGPGWWIGWPTALATATFAEERDGESLRWAVSVNYDRESVGGFKRLAVGTRWMFSRIANTWGMVGIDASRPGSAARSLIDVVSGGESVGVFPEGATQGLHQLHPPQPGAMRLIDRLANAGTIVPVAFYLKNGILVAVFETPVVSAHEAWASIRARLAERAPGMVEER